MTSAIADTGLDLDHLLVHPEWGWLQDDRYIAPRQERREKPTRAGNIWRWSPRTRDELLAEGWLPATDLTAQQWCRVALLLTEALEDR